MYYIISTNIYKIHTPLVLYNVLISSVAYFADFPFSPFAAFPADVDILSAGHHLDRTKTRRTNPKSERKNS